MALAYASKSVCTEQIRMRTKKVRVLALVETAMLVGCAVRRYQPATIVPSDYASKFALRSLSDPGLQTYVEKNLGHPANSQPLKTWDLGTLSLAALYFNPTLDAAQARVAETEAASMTAGARPNPTP